MRAEGRGEPQARGVQLPQPRQLKELAAEYGGTASGPAADAHQVERVVAPEQARSDSDLVLLTRRSLVDVVARAPGLVLTTPTLADALEGRNLWLHRHPLWLLAAVLEPLAPGPLAANPRFSDLAVELPPGIELGPGAVVMSGAVVGAGCSLGPQSVIYPGVRLGARVVIGAGAIVGRPGFGWATGPDGRPRRVPQLGGVVVEDDVEIGPGCTVDAGTLGPTWIGEGVKLDAQVHVGHNVRIGARSLVAAQVGFAGSCRIGRGVLIGGQSGFADHVQVGDRAQIAGKSGVIRDVPDDAVMAGFPAVPRTRWLRAMTLLTRLADAGPRRKR